MDRYLFWISSGVKVLVLSNTVRARSIILVQYKRKTTITLQLTNAESILAESFLASFSEQTSPISSLAAMVNYCSIKAQLFSGGSTPAETWLMQAVGIRLNSQDREDSARVGLLKSQGTMKCVVKILHGNKTFLSQRDGREFSGLCLPQQQENTPKQHQELLMELQKTIMLPFDLLPRIF